MFKRITLFLLSWIVFMTSSISLAQEASVQASNAGKPSPMAAQPAKPQHAPASKKSARGPIRRRAVLPAGAPERWTEFKSCEAAIKSGEYQVYQPTYFSHHRALRTGEEIGPSESTACADMLIADGSYKWVVVSGREAEKPISLIWKRMPDGTLKVVAREDCGNDIRELRYPKSPTGRVMFKKEHFSPKMDLLTGTQPSVSIEFMGQVYNTDPYTHESVEIEVPVGIYPAHELPMPGWTQPEPEFGDRDVEVLEGQLNVVIFKNKEVVRMEPPQPLPPPRLLANPCNCEMEGDLDRDGLLFRATGDFGGAVVYMDEVDPLVDPANPDVSAPQPHVMWGGFGKGTPDEMRFTRDMIPPELSQGVHKVIFVVLDKEGKRVEQCYRYFTHYKPLPPINDRPVVKAPEKPKKHHTWWHWIPCIPFDKWSILYKTVPCAVGIYFGFFYHGNAAVVPKKTDPLGPGGGPKPPIPNN